MPSFQGGHALVALYTEGAMPLHKVTCVPRGHALGIVRTRQKPCFADALNSRFVLCRQANCRRTTGTPSRLRNTWPKSTSAWAAVWPRSWVRAANIDMYLLTITDRYTTSTTASSLWARERDERCFFRSAARYEDRASDGQGQHMLDQSAAHDHG